MHCIVTAGPTAESLDEVRRLTNASTGRLGTELSEYLVAQGCQVTLLRSRLATFHAPGLEKPALEFLTTSELQECLSRLASDGIDAVFHVAAVSDFTFGKIWNRSPQGEMTEIKTRT